MGLIRAINSANDKDGGYNGPLIMQSVLDHGLFALMPQPNVDRNQSVADATTTAPNLSSMAAMVLLNRIRRVQRVLNYRLNGEYDLAGPVESQMRDQGTNTNNIDVDLNPFSFPTMDRSSATNRQQQTSSRALPPTNLMWADSEEFLHDNTTDDDNDDDGLNPFRHALQLLPLRSFPSNISGFLGRIMSDNSSTNTNSGGVVGGGNPVYRRIRQNAGLRESMHQSATTDHLRGDNSGNTALSLNALDRMEAGRSRGSAAGALMVRSNNYNLALSGDGEQQQSPQSELQPSLDSNGQPISSSHSPTSSSNVSGTLEEFMRLSSLLDSAVLDDDTRQVVQERRNHLNRILLRQHVERMAHSFRRDVGLSRDNNQRDQENRRPSDFDPNGAGNAATAAAGDGDDDSDDDDDESGDPFDTNDRDRTSYGQADMRTSTGRRLMHILRERRRQAIRAQIASMR